jgi:tRNA(fMet)-specific endonuclease VapC
MHRYILDTNILSALIKHPHSVLAQKIGQMPRDTFCTSVIVACELRYGVEKKGSVSLAAKVELFLNGIDILPLEYEAVSQHYAALRVFLERQGQVIGANDMLIAAHALSLEAILVTDNVREFARIPDLKLENWLAETNIS